MDQGLITNPKDLERMQHELESLERRISSLEDDELEVMEKLEDAQRELAEYEAMVAETDERLAALAAARDEKLAEIDEQLAQVAGRPRRRPPRACPTTWSRSTRSCASRRAASARPRCAPATCSGCQLSLDSVELSRIKGRRRTRWSAARSAPGSWCAPPSQACDRDTAVVIEADGGSRGNPGPAAYGAVLKDADTGAVIAEDGSTIGVATNNVAEYSGLIAGLRLAEELAPEADVEVRMDSKLVVEQMSGRWKIKHPTCGRWRPRPTGSRRPARRTPGSRGSRTSTPTGSPTRRSTASATASPSPAESLIEEIEEVEPQPPSMQTQVRGWSAPADRRRR